MVWVFAAATGLVGCGSSSAARPQATADGGAASSAGASSGGAPTSSEPPVDPRKGCEALPSRQGSIAARDALFEILTAQAWEGSVCATGGESMFAPSCDRVNFRRDGSFTWSAVSDYLERDENGTWNLEAHDDDSGTLFLSTGDALLFARTNDGLATSRVGLVASAPAPDTASRGVGSADDLPAVAPPAAYSQLLGTCWKKTNEFDRYRMADKLAFATGGSYVATYRSGDCEQSGFIGMDGGRLVSWFDKSCDLRPSAKYLTTEDHALLSDNLLIMRNGTYWPEAFEAHEQLFLVDSWWLQPGKPYQPDDALDWGSARLVGRFNGTLQRGEPLDIQLSVQDLTAEGLTLGPLSVTSQSLALVANGFATAGDAKLAAVHDYAEARLMPGESQTDSLSVVPTAFGEYVDLHFKLPFTLFSGTESTNDVSFVAAVAEGHAPPDLNPVDDSSQAPAPASFQACGTLAGTSGSLQAVAVSPDGSLVAAGAETPAGTVQVWSVERVDGAVTGQLLTTIPGGAPYNPVYPVQFAGGGLLVTTYRNSIRLWDATDGTSRGSLEGHTKDVLTLAVSPNGQLLASGSLEDGQVRVWRLADRTLVTSFISGKGTTFGLGFSPDGTLATGGQDHLVKLWQPTSGALLRTLDEHTDWVSSVAFTADGSQLVSSSFDNSLVVWNVADGALRHHMKAGADVVDMAVTLDGNIAATIDGSVALYNAEGGGPVPPTGGAVSVSAGGHSISRAVAFSADGTLLASADYDGQVHLWCR